MSCYIGELIMCSRHLIFACMCRLEGKISEAFSIQLELLSKLVISYFIQPIGNDGSIHLLL